MKRHKHSLSHYRLTTLNQGVLFPVACLEVLPGDSFRHQTAALLRVSPLVAPVMHPVHVSVHHWYVPNRILWNNWENFITQSDQDLLVPTVNIKASNVAGPMATAFGVGADDGEPRFLNALPFRAYNKIWNEFYRDQDLSNAAPENTGDGEDIGADYPLRNVSWEKDYFTTARHYPQQGEGDAIIGFEPGTTAPVTGHTLAANTAGQVRGKQTGIGIRADSGTASPVYRNEGSGTDDANFGLTLNDGEIPVLGSANLSELEGAGISINEWRKAMAFQRIREHRNRYGSRYRDYLAFLGISSSDSRLQRPEYLGGGKQTISFSEVLSTADSGDSVVGDLAGHGIAALRTRTYKRFFEEHGYVISLISIRPKTIYMNNVPRKFLRRTWDDFWQKELEIMGEQSVSNLEAYFGASDPQGIFGYVPRHDDYRFEQSFVSGEFRGLLDYWHMARNFTEQPVLNGSFVECDPTDRIYADTNTDQIQAMVAHRISARRLVSKRAKN